MRTPRSLNFSRGWNSIPRTHFSNSHGIISFADPHLLNLFISYRYTNHRGAGCSHSPRRSDVSTCRRSDVPLSLSEYTLTSCCLSYKQIAPVTPLECALTYHSQLTENTATLSPAECAVTDRALVSPLECALTKERGGVAPHLSIEH